MIKKIIALIIMAGLFSSQAQGAYLTTFWGVRALGMGTAYTAVADDSDAPLYNIAGIAVMDKPEVTFMSSKAFTGLEGVDISFDYAAFVLPLDKRIGSFSAAWAYEGSTGVRSESDMSIGYARGLNDIFSLIGLKADWMQLSAGVNARYLRVETDNVDGPGNTIIQETQAFDVGVLARFSNGISVGYSGKYLNAPDIGLRMGDPIYATNVLGVAYFNKDLPILHLPYFTIAADWQNRNGQNDIKVGAESRILDGALALRMGGWSEQIDFGAGYGFEFGRDKKSRLSIDYAFGLLIGGIRDSTGSHFFSLTYRFP